MKEILVDANVLLSFLTDRDERQQRLAAELFQAAAAGRGRLFLHQAALAEMVYVLLNLYRVDPGEAARTVGELLAMPGVTAVDEVSWPLVLDRWPHQVPAFGDAVLASVASQKGCDAVATFDLKFRSKLKRLGLTSYWSG